MARDLEALADRLVVTQSGTQYSVVLWPRDRSSLSWLVGLFPDEDSAWGVVSLVIENVNDWGQDEETAIDRAMRTYRELQADEEEARQYDYATAFGIDLDDDSRRAQDHAAEMRVRA